MDARHRDLSRYGMGGKWIGSDYGSLNPVHYILRSVWVGGTVGGRDGLAAACDGITSRRLCSPVRIVVSILMGCFSSRKKKFTLEHATKAHSGSKGITLHFL